MLITINNNIKIHEVRHLKMDFRSDHKNTTRRSSFKTNILLTGQTRLS